MTRETDDYRGEFKQMATALIVGAGSGLSASLARLLSQEGYTIALAARQVDKLDTLAQEIGATSFTADASKLNDVNQLFQHVEQTLGAPEVVIYNPSWRVRRPLIELDPVEVAKTIEVTAYGGFLVAQQLVATLLDWCRPLEQSWNEQRLPE
jgi:NAD(P)-dependent dehydrogenase (short-subunit alcohol dehydrogenase family)